MNLKSFARAGSRTALLSVAIASFALLGGCSTVKGWFGGKDKAGEAATKPAELVEFAPSATVTRLWSAKAGGGEGRLGARQGPAVADGRVYAAAVEGGVRAFDLQTGATVWTYASKLPLSGGPGVGDGIVAVGSLEGDVIALDASTGAEKWKAKVDNEVIAAPAIGQGVVLVHGNDGRVTAFDENTGERRWFWNRDAPLLSVRGNDSPLLAPGLAFVGNDDGTLSALSLTDGRPLWDQTVAEASGRNDLERMADVDGTPALDGITLYASSYKGETVSIDGPSGRVQWSAQSGGPGRVGVGSDRVVVADANGTVWALDKSTGGVMWQQPGLARRNVAGTAVQGDYAVVGDFDGYLHWLKLSDGSFAARQKVGGDAIKAAPVVVDGVLVVQTTGGEVSAWRLAQ
ncbi:MAG: outer membrane protein assembly factor BamB [Thermomonas sp.]